MMEGMDLWADYFRFLDNNPGADDDLIQKATGIHWRGTMHPRYLGLLTEAREVTPAGRMYYKNPGIRERLIHNQLQKWYYWVDVFYRYQDLKYKVYPYITLLKILSSVPGSNYSITRDEFKYFVLPTNSYEECEDRILLLGEYRRNKDTWNKKISSIFEKTYSERIDHLFELSPYLILQEQNIGLKKNAVDEVAQLVNAYEQLESKGKIPHYQNNPQRYLQMLRSDKSIIEFCS